MRPARLAYRGTTTDSTKIGSLNWIRELFGRADDRRRLVGGFISAKWVVFL